VLRPSSKEWGQLTPITPTYMGTSESHSGCPLPQEGTTGLIHPPICQTGGPDTLGAQMGGDLTASQVGVRSSFANFIGWET
jgi:hypothetical protein